MPKTCSVFKCTQRSSRGGPSMFSIPKNPVRRERWIAALNRTSLPRGITVCAKHFVTGKPSKDENHVDFAPSLHLGYRTTPRHLRSPGPRTPSPFKVLKRYHYRKQILGTPPSSRSNEVGHDSSPVDRQIAQRVRIRLWGPEPVDQGQMMPSDPSPGEGKANINHSTTDPEEATSEVDGSVTVTDVQRPCKIEVGYESTPVGRQRGESVRMGRTILWCSRELLNTMAGTSGDFETLKVECGGYRVDESLLDRVASDDVDDPLSEPLIKTEPADDTSRSECSCFPCGIKEECINGAAPDDAEDPLSGLPIQHADDTEMTGEVGISAGEVAGVVKIEEEWTEDVNNDASGEAGLRTGYYSDSKSNDAFSEEKANKCDVCGSEFRYPCDLKRHMRTHNGDKPFPCDICGSRFNYPSHLKRHKRSHTGEKPYWCDLCESKFSDKVHLKVHKRTHTGEKPYSCDTCASKFSEAAQLKVHKRIHSGEKPYSCNMCESKFSDAGHLKVHMRTHTGEKPYLCDICDSRFSDCSTLKAHKRIHTGEKPFSCDFCESKFRKVSDLTVHVRTHTGEKPYSCDVCDSKFSVISSLIRHKRTHTGEKRYPCELCESRFRDASDLKVHMRTHTGEKPYSCDICRLQFCQGSQLMRHLNKTHAV